MPDEFILKEVHEFKPQKRTLPLSDRDDLEADYSFFLNDHPIHLFGVKDAAKARLAAIAVLPTERKN